MAAPVALEMQPHGASIDPRVDPSESDAGLDQRFTALARARGLLRRALAAVAGEFVLKRDWERPGSARLREYATERAWLLYASDAAHEEVSVGVRACGQLKKKTR